MAEEGAAPEIPSLGLPLADPTIGLNAVVSRVRRNRAPPPPPPVPLVAASEPVGPVPTQLSEFDRLIGQATKLFEKHPEDERQRKLDELTKSYEALGIRKAELEAVAKNSPEAAAPAAGGTTPEMAAYLRQNEIDEGGAGNTQIDNLAGSGAHGLYQFMPATWADVVARHPDLGLTKEHLYEKDPVKARKYQTAAMKAFTQDNVDYFAKALGRKPTGGEMYMLHMLGPAGGIRLAQGAAQPLTESVDAAALKGNPGLAKFKTGAEALDYYNRRYS